MNLRKTHDRSRGFDIFLVVVAAIGILTMWVGFSIGGVWNFLGLAALFGEMLLVDGIFVESRRLVVRRYRLPLVREPGTWMRVVLLSDIHAGAFKKRDWFERVVTETAALHPDLLLLGGDYVVDRAEPVNELHVFSTLHAPLGKFFVLGNHDCMDRPQEIRSAIASFGYEDLTNRSVELESNGRRFELAASDDLWLGNPKSFKRSSAAIPHITLSHEPDILMDMKEGKTDLVLAGHTHGGQVRVPFIGSIWPIPTKLGRLADAGKKIMSGVPCIISNGIGETDGRLRLFSPPEIVVVEVGI